MQHGRVMPVLPDPESKRATCIWTHIVSVDKCDWILGGDHDRCKQRSDSPQGEETGVIFLTPKPLTLIHEMDTLQRIELASYTTTRRLPGL